jgi:DNA-binding IclR family transcriptional regulator
MGVLWNDNVSYLFHAPPGIEAARGLGRIGLLPATTSGIGIVLLAQLTDDEVRELYEDKDIPMFPQGVESLLATLEKTRQQGYARVHVADERDHHIVAVTTGVPVIAGLAMSGWIPENATAELVDALRAAALEIA